jgi:AcrR family transcriptional regulator
MNERKTLKYSSPLRANQAAANRTGILRAAHDLFLAKGFGATTIDQIAEAAGVSKPTVFSAVGNKAEVLSAVRDVAMAGDDTPVPVAKRPSAARIAAAPDLSSAVKALSEHIGGVSKRAAGIQEVVRGAAASGDRAMQKLWDTVEEERRRGSMFLVGLVERRLHYPCREKKRSTFCGCSWLRRTTNVSSCSAAGVTRPIENGSPTPS